MVINAALYEWRVIRDQSGKDCGVLVNGARLIGFNPKTTAAYGWQLGQLRDQSHRALPGRILAHPVATSERNAKDEV